MYIPGVSSIYGSRRGRPIPSKENITERVPLRQGRFSVLMAYETAEFKTVGEAPIKVAKGFLTIHRGNII